MTSFLAVSEVDQMVVVKIFQTFYVFKPRMAKFPNLLHRFPTDKVLRCKDWLHGFKFHFDQIVLYQELVMALMQFRAYANSLT